MAKTKKEIFEDYEGFVDKFKPKKTTDDCYTPPHVYKVVLDWVDKNLMKLDGVKIVRPFYPGGDFENYDYPEGCVVIDNPPFSILAKIKRFYHARGIKYFLFAPSLMLAASARELDDTFIVTNANIIYENGANINTSFVTNIDCGYRIWVAGDLNKAIASAQKENKKAKPMAAYRYPIHACSSAILGKIAAVGVSLQIPKDDVAFISSLDSQREAKKSIFGGGWILSERAAAERAAARECTEWGLSEREWEIIRSLGKNKKS